ncbi:MAG: hypothetical protein IK083_09570 [Abditibacteriota bacterium]|nr:hypothetical protein [Abditibacteriota bacterium]
MTRLENELCSAEISVEEASGPVADLSSIYDIVLDPHGISRDPDRRVMSVRIRLKDREYTVALVADKYFDHDRNCAALRGDVMTILQCCGVTQIDVASGRILRTMAFADQASKFGIFSVNGGYLIHGELDILMLNEELEEVWSFSGRDIFVSVTGKKEFEIKEDRICLYDFEDDYYEIDFHGQLIRSVMQDRR